nr:hypothetical protein [Allomuricauda sp.]
MKRMHNIMMILLVMMTLASCGKKEKAEETISTPIEVEKGIMGTWKLVYGEIRTEDSLEVKDLSNTEFVKILNEDHFAFFNQVKDTADGFYGGGGTYSLDGDTYVEQLDYVGVKEIRGHEFTFKLEINGDTLIQSGIEDVPEAGIKRHIVEKYIRIK